MDRTPLAEYGAAMADEMVTPNPGSQAALDRGCMCPVMDNGHGRGMYGGAVRTADDAPIFVFVADCPLHGGGDWNDE